MYIVQSNLFRLYHYISNVVDAEFNIFYFYYPMVWRSILYWFYESSHLDWPAARGDFAVSDCDCKMLRSGELGWRVRFIQSAWDEWKFLLKVKQVWTLPLRDIWGSGLRGRRGSPLDGKQKAAYTIAAEGCSCTGGPWGVQWGEQAYVRRQKEAFTRVEEGFGS